MLVCVMVLIGVGDVIVVVLYVICVGVGVNFFCEVIVVFYWFVLWIVMDGGGCVCDLIDLFGVCLYVFLV